MHAKRVLIVDDDPALRTLLRIVAKRAGFRADVASNGVEALEKLRNQTYDIALVDLMMPRMSGYDFLEHLGSMEERPAVIIVTAMDDPQVSNLDGRVVSSILHKPFDVEIVASLLREFADKDASSRDADDENLLDFRRRG